MGRRAFFFFFSITPIKDTGAKPRVWIEAGKVGGFGWCWVEEWGENAENCNGRTIK